MAQNQGVGLELLYSTAKAQITSSSDVVVCSIHWSLISNGYKCVGLGETQSGRDQKSEMLPEGWADNQDVYIIRYKPDRAEEAFMLKIVKTRETLFVHFMRNRDEKVSTATVKIADFAGDDVTTYNHAFRNTTELNRLIMTDVIRPFSSQCGPARSSPPTQTQSNPTQPIDDDPLRVPSHRPNPQWNDPGDPFSIGRRDLDPLGSGYGPGGGMIMDPFRSPGARLGYDPRTGQRPGLPRGAVPPHARFDPINPPGVRTDPDPDHLPPPGYDDMFM